MGGSRYPRQPLRSRQCTPAPSSTRAPQVEWPSWAQPSSSHSWTCNSLRYVLFPQSGHGLVFEFGRTPSRDTHGFSGGFLRLDWSPNSVDPAYHVGLLLGQETQFGGNDLCIELGIVAVICASHASAGSDSASDTRLDTLGDWRAGWPMGFPRQDLAGNSGSHGYWIRVSVVPLEHGSGDELGHVADGPARVAL